MMWLKCSCVVIVVMLSVSTWTAGAWSGGRLEQNDEVHNMKIDGLTEKADVYLFGVQATSKPYNFINADGKLTGFDVDVVNAVCAVAKKKCSTVLRQKDKCIFTDRGIDYAGEELMSGAIQGCAGYQITTDRKNEFAFTLPYYKGVSTYAVYPGNPTAFKPDLEDFTKFRLVQEGGSAFNTECLTRQGKTFKPVILAADAKDATQAILNKTADVYISTRETIAGLEVLRSAQGCDGGHGTGLMLKLGSDVPQWWNPAFRQLYKSHHYYVLCKEAGRKYNVTIDCLPRPDQADQKLIDLILHDKTQEDHTPSERLWKFVVSGRIYPYSYLNKEGEFQGWTKEFIKNICQIAGKKCVLLLAEVPECSVRVGEKLYPGRGLISGWFDACTGYFNTVDRRNSWDFTDPYLVSNASFFVAPGNPSDFDPSSDDYSSFTIVYQATAITNDHCLHRLKKKAGNLMEVEDEVEAKEAVLSGKADAWFTKLTGQTGLLRLPQRFHCENVGSSVMVRKGSELPTWWNKAFGKFKQTGGFHQFCSDQAKLYNTSFPCVPN